MFPSVPTRTQGIPDCFSSGVILPHLVFLGRPGVAKPVPFCILGQNRLIKAMGDLLNSIAQQAVARTGKLRPVYFTNLFHLNGFEFPDMAEAPPRTFAKSRKMAAKTKKVIKNKLFPLDISDLLLIIIQAINRYIKKKKRSG